MVDGEGVAEQRVSLLVLGLWGAVGAVLAVRGFSWEARRDLMTLHAVRPAR